jgi:LuxR family quorum-sensing system transcriptional regulator CciR
MSSLKIAQDFVEQARLAQSALDLFHLLEDATREIGFSYFALVHHTDLRDSTPQIVKLYNYPSAWVEYFVNNALYAEDPIHLASLLSNVGFSWTEVPNKIRITNRQHKILEMAGRHGLRNGYTVPANIPGESTGSCSFAMKDGAGLPEGSLLLAELIGDFAFEAARRLGGVPTPAPLQTPTRLTPRQHDCLVLVIHGRTDKEIARALRISEDTVTEYLDVLRRRYGVKNRLMLAVRAIHDGQISFIEAFAPKPPLRGG